MSGALLRLRDIKKKVGMFELRDVSLDLASGEYFVILGPSGAGKTLLLEIIAGLHMADEGEIWLEGSNITRWPPEKRQIGFVYQDCALFPHLNVKENIVFGLRAKRAPADTIRRELENIVSLLGISHLLDRYPATLSGGEKQRVALARALVMKPRLLLLDEPLSALDFPTREALRSELKRLHGLTGTLMIHVTHNFDEAMLMADRIAVIIGGQIRQVGHPDEIFNRPQSKTVAHFVGVENVYCGEIVKVDGAKKSVQLGAARLFVETKLEGKVGFSFRPEHIIVSAKPHPLNCLEGVVVLAEHQGLTTRLVVDVGGEKLVVRYATNGAGTPFSSPGASVFCTIPPEVINVFPEE